MSARYKPSDWSIKKEKKVFDKALLIEEGLIAASGETGKKAKSFKRLRVNRQDAVVVFIHNTDTDKVVLTRQFRYAIASRVEKPILELVAGKIAPGEDLISTVIRECLEECGYAINPDKLRTLFSVFASPGYSSERFHFFHATVKEGDKRTAGGGLEEENEFIEVVEMPYDSFMAMADDNQLEDAKTLLVACYLKAGNFKA